MLETRSLPENHSEDHGEMLLARTIKEIARGNFDALDTLYSIPGIGGVAPKVAELAESIGMILLKLEAREFHLECAAEAEQRLRDLNQLKDTYLGIAAHDLKNPLSAIRGLSQMLVESELDEPTQRKFKETIYRVSDQMVTLVNNLLDISVIESGELKLNLSKSNLSKLARERVDLVERTAQIKKIELVVELHTLPDTLFDADRMRQVFDNLLSNAIKFSPAGATVKLICRQLSRNLEIAVTDQGPGIPPEEIGELFGTFKKLSIRPTGGEGSTGLGLSIVKSIVDAHGGKIDVDSKVGRGTTFIVHLPEEPTIQPDSSTK